MTSAAVRSISDDAFNFYYGSTVGGVAQAGKTGQIVYIDLSRAMIENVENKRDSNGVVLR